MKEKDIAKCLQVGKIFNHGVNKNGYPCGVHFTRLHRPENFQIEETCRFKYYWLMKILQKKKQ